MSPEQWSALFAGGSAAFAALGLTSVWFARRQAHEARRQANEAKRVADIESERAQRERTPSFAVWLSHHRNELSQPFVRLHLRLISAPSALTSVRVELYQGVWRFALPPVQENGNWRGLDAWRARSVEFKQGLAVGKEISWGLTLPVDEIEGPPYREFPFPPLSIACTTENEQWPDSQLERIGDHPPPEHCVRLAEVYQVLASDADLLGPGLQKVYLRANSQPEVWVRRALDETGEVRSE